MKRLAIILLSARIIGGAPALASDPRLWTDARGTQINGTFIKRSEDGITIHIRHSDGKSISIPMVELSASDKLYVMERSAKDFRETLSPEEPSFFVIRRSIGKDGKQFSISREIDIGNGSMLELSILRRKQGYIHKFGDYVIKARVKSPATHLDVNSLKQSEFQIDGESFSPAWMGGVQGTIRYSCFWRVPQTWFERIANATEVEGHFGR